MLSEVGKCYEFEIPVIEKDIQRWKEEENFGFLVSAAKRGRSEVKMRDLTMSEHQQFTQAKNKEIKAWIDHHTVRKILRNQLRPEQILRSRWILTWKRDESGNQTAKARIVIIGYEDPDISEISGDAPTLGKDARSLLLQLIASSKWELMSFDVSTAFLKGQGDGRVLGVEVPAEMKEKLGMTEDQVCQLMGGAYGRIDAPLLWFRTLRDTLLELGFKQCPFDACAFSLSGRNQQGKVVRHGVLGIHVDDGLGGGDRVFDAAIQELHARFPFGSLKKRQFVFTGIEMIQESDYSIKLSQTRYVQDIEAISITKERRKELTSEVTEEEITRLRGLNGSIQFAAVHTRPDLSARVGRSQSRVNSATIEDLLEGNRMLHYAKTHSDMYLLIPSIPVDEMTYCVFSDASFATQKDQNSYSGVLIVGTTASLMENQLAIITPTAWSSKKIPRVVRSTLSAEAVSLSNSLDRLSWIRLAWEWFKNSEVNWREPEKILRNCLPAGAVTDCKSVFDSCTKNSIPNCEEHRTTLECLLIRERLGENVKLRWVPSAAQLADCLTKVMDGANLRLCLKSGKYALYDEHQVLRKRADKRESVNWLKEASEAKNDVERC